MSTVLVAVGGNMIGNELNVILVDNLMAALYNVQ